MTKTAEKGKVGKAMHEKKEGNLKTGTGKKVTSDKQAIAIGLSEARKAGAKVSKKKEKISKVSSKKSLLNTKIPEGIFVFNLSGNFRQTPVPQGMGKKLSR